jgi:DNA-binding transcriptional MerR regulator
MSEELRRRQVARDYGVPIETLRRWESHLRLLPPLSAASHSVYEARLRIILACRADGIPMQQIRPSLRLIEGRRLRVVGFDEGESERKDRNHA